MTAVHPMQKVPMHWPSVLILLCVLLGTGLFLLSAAGQAATSVYLLATGGDDPAGSMIAAAAAGFEVILLAASAWFVFQRTRGATRADGPARHAFVGWHAPAALAISALALALGAWVSMSAHPWLGWLVLPGCTLLVIVPPVWMISGLGAARLDLGPRWRAWGILGLGMTLGPLTMLTLELLTALIGAIIAALFLVSQPDLLQDFLRLAPSLNRPEDLERALEGLAPLALRPGVIAAALGYIALLVPMIEELLKPLGVWLFARSIEHPAQGFGLGVLSGAAYALVESLGVSGRGGSDWAVVVGVRAATSLLHITTAGLMGWAIVSAFQRKQILRLAGMYALVVLIHGIWNGAAAGVAIAVLADAVGNSAWLARVSAAAVGGMSVLAGGMLAILITANRQLKRAPSDSAPSPPLEGGALVSG